MIGNGLPPEENKRNAIRSWRAVAGQIIAGEWDDAEPGWLRGTRINMQVIVEDLDCFLCSRAIAVIDELLNRKS